MRVVLTEEQYTLIERIINEAAIPFSKKIEKGGYIEVIYMIGGSEKSNAMKITEVYSGGKYIQGTSTQGVFIINVTASLDEDNNTFSIIKDAKYEGGQKTADGKILAPKIIGGTKLTVKNVMKLIISDVNKIVVDEVYTNLGTEKIKNGDIGDEKSREDFLLRNKDRSEEKKSREKRVYDLVMSDPTLKKAFYHQPSILKGLMNYGSAKGIGPAQSLIDKYLTKKSKEKDDKKSKDKEFGEFKVNKSVLFELAGKPVRLSYGEESFSILSGKNYNARYVGSRYLKGKIEGKVFKIYMKESLGTDIYKGTIKAFFKEGDESIVDKMTEIVIRIKDYNY
jgi:hypothetical protein